MSDNIPYKIIKRVLPVKSLIPYMSANIPLEIQEEIIKRALPVKSLIRFRSVSKQWKSLIDSPEFIADYSVNPAQPHLLLVTYTDKVDYDDKYVSIADDDSFPHHKFPPFVPPIVKLLRLVSILDCSHGLVSLFGFSEEDEKKILVVLWNPSVRKSVGIRAPIPYRSHFCIGVGVCPKTCDPKIVAYACSRSEISWKAEVYTLSSGYWRSISLNLRWPLTSASILSSPVVIDGVIHWIAFDNHPLRIISFDLTSEEFDEVELLDSFTRAKDLSISNFKGSLVVLVYSKTALVCDVWSVIKTGDPKSKFTKLFTASLKRKDDRIIGFRKNGHLIMQQHECREHDGLLVTTLEVYESCSEHNNHLPVSVSFDSCILKTFYTESLLLLNHSDSVIL